MCKRGASVAYSDIRMLHDMSDGSQDIVVGAAPTEERLRFLNFPLDDGKPDSGLFFTQAVLSFYTREDEQNVSWDGQVLRAANPIVGVVRNHVGETIGRAHGWSMDDATQVSQNIAKLRHGRFDVILQTSLEMTSDMEAENGLRKLMPPVAVINYYAPVSHQFFAAYPEFSKSSGGSSVWRGAPILSPFRLAGVDYRHLFPAAGWKEKPMRWLLRGILFFAGLGAGVAFAAPCPPQIRLMFPDNAIAPFILGDGEEFADPPGLFFAQSVLSFYTRENEKNVSWDGQVLSAANPVVGVVRGQVGENHRPGSWLAPGYNGENIKEYRQAAGRAVRCYSAIQSRGDRHRRCGTRSA